MDMDLCYTENSKKKCFSHLFIEININKSKSIIHAITMNAPKCTKRFIIAIGISFTRFIIIYIYGNCMSILLCPFNSFIFNKYIHKMAKIFLSKFEYIYRRLWLTFNTLFCNFFRNVNETMYNIYDIRFYVCFFQVTLFSFHFICFADRKRCGNDSRNFRMQIVLPLV